MTARALTFSALILLASCGGGDDGDDADYGSGSVCGVPAIQGERIGGVPGAGSCGIEGAVRVTAVSGVALSQSAVINCETARALNNWVRQSAKPALSGQHGGLVKLRVAAHYVCRTRNHKKGARVSEHGFGRAIDISGFYLRDGTELTILGDYRRKDRAGQALRRVNADACGMFGTVLGPGSDGYHEDHLHLDTASHRGGPYCR